VFNRSADKEVDTRVLVPGFEARRVKRWTVNGPSLEATNQGAEEVREAESGVTTPITGVTAVSLRHVFPAHSLTAIELYR
jgi:hypothetical protein